MALYPHPKLQDCWIDYSWSANKAMKVHAVKKRAEPGEDEEKGEDKCGDKRMDGCDRE